MENEQHGLGVPAEAVGPSASTLRSGREDATSATVPNAEYEVVQRCVDLNSKVGDMSVRDFIALLKGIQPPITTAELKPTERIDTLSQLAKG